MIHQDLTKLSQEQLIAEIAKLQATKNKVTFKVSDKGCLTMHGGRLRRFGVTLYASEWDTILNNASAIKAAIEANKDKLSFKE